MKYNVLLSATLASILGGCVGEEADLSSTAAPTWDEFLADTHQEADTGVYIVDGDVPVADIKQLREYYDTAVAGNGALLVYTSGGSDRAWSATDKLNITYCVSSSSFGTSRYSTVVTAMNNATAAWEGVANINFVHTSSLDGSCTASQTGVQFDVRLTSDTSYLARAFFPGDARSSRNILISTSAFGSISPWTLTGILRHELGHTLGFRHEHTRSTSNSCYEDSSWRALTAYDAASVMHYPQCAGTQTGDLVITSLDASGAAALYGAPGSGGGGGGGGGETGTPATATMSGSIATGAWAYSAALPVVAGTTFTATMTGTGDPDLYVHFGAQPTTTAFTCRPYLSSASESCSETVPPGATTAYVGVRGYRTGTYNVAISYRRP
jgi:serine protease